jgi:hypothetical protein
MNHELKRMWKEAVVTNRSTIPEFPGRTEEKHEEPIIRFHNDVGLREGVWKEEFSACGD